MEETKECFSPNTERTLAETFRLVASHHSAKKKILIYLRGHCQRSSCTNTLRDALWALQGECTLCDPAYSI